MQERKVLKQSTGKQALERTMSGSVSDHISIHSSTEKLKTKDYSKQSISFLHGLWSMDTLEAVVSYEHFFFLPLVDINISQSY